MADSQRFCSRLTASRLSVFLRQLAIIRNCVPIPASSTTVGHLRLGITGANDGVSLSGSSDVLLDEVWIHDSASRGADVQNDLRPTSLALRRSLLEGNAAR